LIGFGSGVIGGVAFALFQFGVLARLPLLLTGVLVGEAVGAVAGRFSASAGLAGGAFACRVVGPVLGRGALIAMAAPVEGLGARLATGLMLAARSMAGFELLLLLIAGVLAATRVQNR